MPVFDECVQANTQYAKQFSQGDHDFLPFSDLEQSVHDDLAILRSSPLIPRDIPIAGAIYDVTSGRLLEVARA